MAVAGGLYYYFKSATPAQSGRRFNRDTVIRVLTRFRRDYYPILKNLSKTHKTITDKYKRQFGYIPQKVKESMHSAMTDSNPHFRTMVQKLETQTYSQFAIDSPSDFEAFVQKLSKTDIEVKLIMQDIRTNLVRACAGELVSLDIPVAGHVTPLTVFKIWRQITYTAMLNLNTFLRDYVARHGSLDMYNAEFNKGVKRSMLVDQTMSRLFADHKLDYSAEFHENMVFDSVIENVLKKDPKYKQLMRRVSDLETVIIGEHLSPLQNYTKLRDKIEEIKLVGAELFAKKPEDGTGDTADTPGRLGSEGDARAEQQTGEAGSGSGQNDLDSADPGKAEDDSKTDCKIGSEKEQKGGD